MPKGIGFIDYPVFEQGYEALKQAAGGFALLDSEALLILTATRGKVFALRNLDRLIDCTRLSSYRSK